jgi:hypothetical protein
MPQSKSEIDNQSLSLIFLHALRAASDHLDYCGYGDSWERECAMNRTNGPNLPEVIIAALEAAEKAGL